MSKTSSTSTAAAIAAPPRKIQTEQMDFARKVNRKIADFSEGRLSPEEFTGQIGGLSAGFFNRMEGAYEPEILQENFPNVYPFDDFRTDFQDRVEEIMAEREPGRPISEDIKNALIKITKEFSGHLTGIQP